MGFFVFMIIWLTLSPVGPVDPLSPGLPGSPWCQRQTEHRLCQIKNWIPLQLHILKVSLEIHSQMVLWVRGNQCFQAGLLVQLGLEVQHAHLVQQDPWERSKTHSINQILGQVGDMYGWAFLRGSLTAGPSFPGGPELPGLPGRPWRKQSC